MKIDLTKDLLQEQIPTNDWLIKDNESTIIRRISDNVLDVEHLNADEEQTMQRLIDFVRYSQDPDLNPEDKPDHLRPAVGLAAPQIGINKNLFFIRIEWDKDDLTKVEEIAAINPKILSRSSQIVALEDGEGCLSVDIDHEGLVPRSYKVIVSYYDYLSKKLVNRTLRGYQAVVFQHEYDHNIGKLYYDHINQENPYFKKDDWLFI
ncbi:Peptide deformylase 2 [Mesoplasma sp. JKS002658]|uniref:peptide deformylase n=1 Tax=Mesoplasma whartonense TaxID=2878854 RepID=UPI002022B38A|nr:MULTISPECIES: peptide deformylase [unclassified Mesoplasma]MCL8211516.1 Peptide deformylase 2 [Mesoplasma sp. JKS002664]MCL8211976.1 Peptide deformylase 2 [Mesoplasma sp. JKS002662]MCL8213596.1 Peptide deformylase 2 [Mesoplasma sp. JKS002660]MCL8213919.1 Peptide deformylase 2 [Mesoplasma sp. JKS002658]MCL8214885.1 Peptide deformylase 2 [Mesoplasma sp. JKS002663]